MAASLAAVIAVAACGCGAPQTEENLQDISAQLAEARQWDVVTFGSCEQDGNIDDGAEPLEWYVLDITGDKALLLSVFVLDCLPYHDSAVDITWADCSLRTYLNGTFYEETFSDAEKKKIEPYENENTGNTLLEIDGGENTQDNVFLLSQEQADVYFNEEQEQWFYERAEATQTAVEAGVYVSEDGYSPWWLRGPGNETYSAKFVEPDGSIYTSGAEVDIDYRYGIRPAVCINILSQQ